MEERKNETARDVSEAAGTTGGGAAERSGAHPHPLADFIYCPRCGGEFRPNNGKSNRCLKCGFVYYFNPSSAVACFITDPQGRVLVSRRAFEPAAGTLDLHGGFVDCFETVEQAVHREVMEETGLEIESLRYLFSRHNIYPYSGFEVHTTDLIFEARTGSFEGCRPQDDVAELLAVEPEALDPSQFGLRSIAEAVAVYKARRLAAGR